MSVAGTGGHVRLGAEEARRRFGWARVARLATVSADGQPHLVPVTFAMDGDVIYTAVDAKPKSTGSCGGSATSGRTRGCACSPITTPTTGRRCGGCAPTARPRSSAIPPRWRRRSGCWPGATRNTRPIRRMALLSLSGSAAGPAGQRPDGRAAAPASQARDRGNDPAADDLERGELPDVGYRPDGGVETHRRELTEPVDDLVRLLAPRPTSKMK